MNRFLSYGIIQLGVEVGDVKQTKEVVRTRKILQ